MNSAAFSLLVLSAVALSCPAGARAEPVEVAARPCILVLGGGGTLTGNEEIDGNWFNLNSVISNAVVETLAARGYRVEPLIIDDKDGAARFRALWSAFSQDHCPRTVQISHELKAKEGRLDSFAIRADVLHFKLGEAGDEAKPVGDYKKAYDFPLNPEAMKNLSLTDVGVRVAEDLAAAGVLPR